MNWSLIFEAVTAVAALLGSLAVIGVVRQIQFTSWIKAEEIFMDSKFRKARGAVLQDMGVRPTQLTDMFL